MSACNNGDSSSDSKGASKVEDTQKSEDGKKGNDSKSSSSKESSNHSSNSKQSSANDISNLSEKEKLALVFLANESGEYAITKNDILTGRYTTQMSDGKKTGDGIYSYQVGKGHIAFAIENGYVTKANVS